MVNLAQRVGKTVPEDHGQGEENRKEAGAVPKENAEEREDNQALDNIEHPARGKSREGQRGDTGMGRVKKSVVHALQPGIAMHPDDEKHEARIADPIRRELFMAHGPTLEDPAIQYPGQAGDHLKSIRCRAVMVSPMTATGRRVRSWVKRV